MEPTTKRYAAIIASLLLVAAPALAQQGSSDDYQDSSTNDTNNTSTSDGSDGNGTDYNDTDRNQTDGSDRDGTSDGARDGNRSDESDRGEPDGNASDVGKDARDFARDAPENAKRNVSVLVDGAQALVDMSSEDNPGQDKIGLDMAADQGRMDMSFDRDADDGERPDFELSVQLADIVEYEDLDGDGAYDPGEDRVLGTTQVTDLDWSVDAKEVALDANSTGQQIRAEAPLAGNDTDANGTVAVVVTAPGDFAEIGGTELTPRDVKVDYVIENYPYESANASLALGVSVGGEDGVEIAQSKIGDTPAVQVTKDDVTGYFGWKETAQVDGVTVPVNASLPDQASDNATDATQKVYMSYGHGDEIVHDPVMGVSYETASEDLSGAPAPGAAALVAALVGAAAIGRAALRRD